MAVEVILSKWPHQDVSPNKVNLAPAACPDPYSSGKAREILFKKGQSAVVRCSGEDGHKVCAACPLLGEQINPGPHNP